MAARFPSARFSAYIYIQAKTKKFPQHKLIIISVSTYMHKYTNQDKTFPRNKFIIFINTLVSTYIHTNED